MSFATAGAAAAIKANAAMNRFIISSMPLLSARRALKSALPEEPTSTRTDVSCLQCVRIHRDEYNDALDEPIRVRIGADLLETATDDLEDQRAQDDGREYVSAPAEQRDAADHDGGDGGELHAVADLGGVHPDLQRVDDARNRRECARDQQSCDGAPVDRDTDPSCDILVVANRGKLAPECRPAVQELYRQEND